MNVRTACGILAAMAWLAAAAGPGAAAKEEQPECTIHLLAIHATNQEKAHCDAHLEPVKEALAESGYNSFRLIDKPESRPVRMGRLYEKRLPEDYALRVRPDDKTEDKVRLTVVWVRYEKDKDGKRTACEKLKMPVTIRKAKYFLSGRWKLKEGALIAAVAAE